MFSLTNEIFDELGIKEQTHSFCSAETTAETRLVNLVISSPYTLKKRSPVDEAIEMVPIVSSIEIFKQRKI